MAAPRVRRRPALTPARRTGHRRRIDARTPLAARTPASTRDSVLPAGAPPDGIARSYLRSSADHSAPAPPHKDSCRQPSKISDTFQDVESRENVSKLPRAFKTFEKFQTLSPATTPIRKMRVMQGRAATRCKNTALAPPLRVEPEPARVRPAARARGFAFVPVWTTARL